MTPERIIERLQDALRRAQELSDADEHPRAYGYLAGALECLIIDLRVDEEMPK